MADRILVTIWPVCYRSLNQTQQAQACYIHHPHVVVVVVVIIIMTLILGAISWACMCSEICRFSSSYSEKTIQVVLPKQMSQCHTNLRPTVIQV